MQLGNPRSHWAVVSCYLTVSIAIVGCGRSEIRPSDTKSRSGSDKTDPALDLAAIIEISTGRRVAQEKLDKAWGWLKSGSHTEASEFAVDGADCELVYATNLDRLLDMGSCAIAQNKAGRWCFLVGYGNEKAQPAEEWIIGENGGPLRRTNKQRFAEEWTGKGFACRPKSASTSKARLWLPSSTIDIGEVAGDHGEITGFVVNRSSADLSIDSAVFNCSCGSIEFGKQVIPAFGTSSIKIAINALGKSEGPFNLAVRIKTKPLLDENLLLNVVGRIVHPTRLDPPTVFVGDVHSHHGPIKVESILKLSHPGQVAVSPAYLPEGIAWDGAVAETDRDVRISLLVNRSVLASAGEDVGITATAFLSVSAINGDGEGGTKTLPLTIKGRKIPFLQLSATKIFLGDCLQSTDYTRELKIFIEDTATATVVALHPEAVTATVDGNTIKLRLHSPKQLGLFQTMIFIRVGDAFTFVPIVGVVRNSDNPAVESEVDPIVGQNLGLNKVEERPSSSAADSSGRLPRRSSNNSAAPESNCFFQAVTWPAWTSYSDANWAVVLSPRQAAKATFALNADPKFRRFLDTIRTS